MITINVTIQLTEFFIMDVTKFLLVISFILQCIVLTRTQNIGE